MAEEERKKERKERERKKQNWALRMSDRASVGTLPTSDRCGLENGQLGTRESERERRSRHEE